MLAILFFFLAGCAVRCDNFNNNNYVIEMPDENQTRHSHRKPLKVYWNVPTMQCRSKRIPFENLFEKYGIIQNKGDSFRGNRIAILYDPGLFPALLTNETSKTLVYRNGGVPQEGSLERHMENLRTIVNQSVPDPEFDGVGILDFESWRPILRQNFGVLVPYKEISYQIEKKRHWWWTDDWLRNEAKIRFEHAAHIFMEASLNIVKEMRPRASWGYYGYPHCFNSLTTEIERCSNEVRDENDRTDWLWSGSAALYPSVYSSQSLNTNQLTSFIKGRVAEAARVARKGTLILPYFWFRYRDGGYLSERDLKAALQTFYKSKADGFMIWGSSGDVRTVDKCNNLLNYIDNVMGPAIAKYTKAHTKDDDYNDVLYDDDNRTDTIAENDETLTLNKSEKTNAVSLETNTHDLQEQGILKYIEKEYHKLTGANFDTKDRDECKKLNESILLQIIMKAVKRLNQGLDTEEHKIRHKNSKKGHAKKVTSTTSAYNDDLTNVQGEQTTIKINDNSTSEVQTSAKYVKNYEDTTTEVYSTTGFDTTPYSTTEIDATTVFTDTTTSITEANYEESTTNKNDYYDPILLTLNSLVYGDENNMSTTDIYSDFETDDFTNTTTAIYLDTISTIRETEVTESYENPKSRRSRMYENNDQNLTNIVTESYLAVSTVDSTKRVQMNSRNSIEDNNIFINEEDSAPTIATSDQVYNSSSKPYWNHQYFLFLLLFLLPDQLLL